MSEILKTGGLIGVGYWDAAVYGTSIKNITASIKYDVNLVGINHIALGSDFDGTFNSPIDSGELSKLTAELIKEGFNHE